MKTLFAFSFAVVAAVVLAVSPAPALADGSPGFAHRPSVFPKPVNHWAHWGKPAHGHFQQGHFQHGHFHKPAFVVPRPVVVFPSVPVFVAPHRVWTPGFWAWSGHYWVWFPGHWR